MAPSGSASRPGRPTAAIAPYSATIAACAAQPATGCRVQRQQRERQIETGATEQQQPGERAVDTELSQQREPGGSAARQQRSQSAGSPDPAPEAARQAGCEPCGAFRALGVWCSPAANAGTGRGGRPSSAVSAAGSPVLPRSSSVSVSGQSGCVRQGASQRVARRKAARPAPAALVPLAGRGRGAVAR